MTTPGQAAYERDLKAQPLYHDGTQRPRWRDLPEYARDSWERNPTDRPWFKHGHARSLSDVSSGE